MVGEYGMTTFGASEEIDWAEEARKAKAAFDDFMKHKRASAEGDAKSQELLDKYVSDAKNKNLHNYYETLKELEEEAASFAGELATTSEKKEIERRKAEEKKFQEYAQQEYNRRIAAEQKKHGELSAERREEIAKEVAEDKELRLKANKDVAEDEKKQRRAAGKAQSIEKFNSIFEKGATPKERLAAVKNLATGPDGEKSFKALTANLTAGLAGLAKQLENKMDEVGKHKAGIDTRLYGSQSNETSWLGNSYFDKISQTFTGIAGASPFILQADLIGSLETLVEKGISYNVQQRAFLATVSDKIATTFEVTDGTLLKLVRVQQADSTAARMGMESALNSFLNSMYETTEYLSDIADTVRGNLYEAQALMEADVATEFEYQVQKWLGSMYSVGMSDSAVTSISTALGQLAAGEIDALTGGGVGNLLVMAANQTGNSIANILENGLNGEETNELLNAAVEYLGTLAAQSDSKVVQQQLASVFGIKASDLKAIANLRTEETIKSINDNSMTYSNMIQELNTRANTMYQRISVGEMMSNVWENVQYSVAAGMANNPVTYLLYKVGGLLEETTGGIDLPFLNVYGFGVDLNTTVAQLMQAGAMAGGVLSSLGSMIGGLAAGAGGGFSGAGMLKALGVKESLDVIERGTPLDATSNTSGLSTSSSGSALTGNGSSADIEGAHLAQAADEKNSLMQQGVEEFDKDATNSDIVDALGSVASITKEGTDAIVYSLEKLLSAMGADGVLGGFTGNAGINRNFGG